MTHEYNHENAMYEEMARQHQDWLDYMADHQEHELERIHAWG